MDVNRAKAAHIAAAGGTPPPTPASMPRPAYDILLGEYERGMTSARIDQVFAEVRQGLVPLIALLRAKGTAPDNSWLTREGMHYDLQTQAALCRQIALDMGFDITRGRLDVSVHPFTGMCVRMDVRVLVR